MAQNRDQLQRIEIPGPGDIITSLSKKILASPKAKTFIVLWMVGLFCMLYASAPVPTTEAMRDEFADLMDQADSVDGYQQAYQKLSYIEEKIYQHDGWFIGSEARAIVNDLKTERRRAYDDFARLDYKREELRREAFNVVGLWSEYGINEARQLFWDCLEKGKGFARRSTMWDMIFGLAMGRDEGIGAFIVRVIINFVFNVTMGLIGAILAFMYYLYSMVLMYKASMASGLLFFGVMLLAGISMAFVYIFVIYGAVAGAGYFVVRTAVNAQIREGEGRGQQRAARGIAYGQHTQRPHYE